MGKAIGISIGYWFGCSAFLYAVAFIFNTTIKSTEIMSSVGYAMFGFIVMLLADYAEKGQRDFYAAWLTVGFLSAAKLASVLRASDNSVPPPFPPLSHPLRLYLVKSRTLMGCPPPL